MVRGLAKLQTYNFGLDKEPEPEHEEGKKVFLEFSDGETLGPYTIKKAHFNRLTTVFMYSFHETTICCAECYLKENFDDEPKKFTEVMHFKDQLGIASEGIVGGNIALSGARMPSGNAGLLFFRPDDQMIQWLKEYANGRIIIDVGCGTGWLLEELDNIGQKAMGIEPYWDVEESVAMNRWRIEQGKQMIHVLGQPVEQCGHILKALGDKALMIFCRPCHSMFVVNALKLRPKGMEALYITVERNLYAYRDLGMYQDKAKRITHKGSSIDNEVVLSIK